MTAARTTAPLNNPDDNGGRRMPRPDTAHPEASEQVAPKGGAPIEEPHGSVEEPPKVEDAGVLALRPRTRPDGGSGRPGRRWVFHGEVQTISGPEADRIRAELAAVIRDLLLWAAGEGTGNGTSDEEAA
ncbi:hypothetical protein [Frankia tisae]|uniref:hypothetical protein n=1 Tax=Frankia tisae TaxID=2950104 RepID=UPI0021C15182|nr:hypothetical protein [Frankia tisae]